MAKVKHRLTTRKPWTYDTKVIDLLHESHGLMTRNSWTLTLTYFTLHFSCCFTKILHSQLTPLLNNFTMQEKCY